MEQKSTMLSSVPLFAGCGSGDLRAIGQLADEVAIPAGKVLAKEGATGHEFFVIVDGSVEITRGGRRLATLGPGDFFGELAMIGKVPRTATATTTVPSRVLVLGHREFMTLLASHPGIQQKVLKNVATWVANAEPKRAV
jgi:CRP/FNR family transcriptional regulator, cyclic AMP receptor protein